MEALTVLEGEQKRNRRQLESLLEQLIEVKRNVISPLALSLADRLAEVRAETNDLFKEYTSRLFRVLDVLGSDAELIHPTPEIFRGSRAKILIADEPTDNLILACILDHARRDPAGSKVFLSENRRDFDTNEDAKVALGEAGVRYFADASKFLQWHLAGPEE